MLFDASFFEFIANFLNLQQTSKAFNEVWQIKGKALINCAYVKPHRALDESSEIFTCIKQLR